MVFLVNLFSEACVLSLNTFVVEFQKKETHFVPPRNFYSLTFRKSGKISITSKEKTYISAAPCITFVPKGCGYNTEIIESGSMIAVHFDMTKEAENIDDIMLFHSKNSAILQNLFSALLDKSKIENPKDYACLSVFYEILAILDAETNKNSTSKVSKRALKVRDYIERNFSNENLSVALLAENFGVSQAYLRREFKEAFGVSPLTYINSVRFNNAKAMLKTGYYSINDVAKNCGFMSLSYFSYAFRNACGISPSEFLKQI